MKGSLSRCSICGAQGTVYGYASWYDKCEDTVACSQRALRKKDQEIETLKSQVKILESK